MTTTDLATSGRPEPPSIDGAIAEQVLARGDLKPLTPAQRVAYYRATCESLALNYLTRPFEYIEFQGKLTLYARRDAAEQLRRRDHVSISILAKERIEDTYLVHARATTPDGRQDESIGAVSLAGLRGADLANAYMRAETKSKRRVTLSICGLGFLDETEVETVPGARLGLVNVETGEIAEAPGLVAAPADEGPTLRQVVKEALRLELTNRDVIAAWLQQAGVKRLEDLHPDGQAGLRARLEQMIAQHAGKLPPGPEPEPDNRPF